MVASMAVNVNTGWGAAVHVSCLGLYLGIRLMYVRVHWAFGPAE
ncbi:MAG: hypothetical protein WBM12_10680 [Pseudolabrys sp.]